MITLRIPVLALIVVMVGKLFPNFSPILHRSITAQGIIQKSTKGYYLQANDKDKTLWTLRPKSQNVNLADFQDQKVEIKGNLTPTLNLIEVSEVVSFDPKPTPTPTVSAIPSSLAINVSMQEGTASLESILCKDSGYPCTGSNNIGTRLTNGSGVCEF